MNKKILGIIPPDTYDIKEKILSIIENQKFKIIQQDTILLRNEDVEMIYSDLKDDPVWSELMAAVKKGPVLVFVVQKKRNMWTIGIEIIKRIPILKYNEEKKSFEELKELVGNIDEANTIRGKFALNRTKHAIYINGNCCEKEFAYLF